MKKFSRNAITSCESRQSDCNVYEKIFTSSRTARYRNSASGSALRLLAGQRTLTGLASSWATSTVVIRTREMFNPFSPTSSDGDAKPRCCLPCRLPSALWKLPSLTSRGRTKGVMDPSTRLPHRPCLCQSAVCRVARPPVPFSYCWVHWRKFCAQGPHTCPADFGVPPHQATGPPCHPAMAGSTSLVHGAPPGTWQYDP